MAIPQRYVPTTRNAVEKIVLNNLQFSRWLARRTGVSNVAIGRALQIITRGIVEALANGYNINLLGLGCFETRELIARKRYSRILKKHYISPPSTIAHFKKSASLNFRIRQLAETALDETMIKPTTKPVATK